MIYSVFDPLRRWLERHFHGLLYEGKRNFAAELVDIMLAIYTFIHGTGTLSGARAMNQRRSKSHKRYQADIDELETYALELISNTPSHTI